MKIKYSNRILRYFLLAIFPFLPNLGISLVFTGIVSDKFDNTVKP